MNNYMVFPPNEFLSASSDDQATQRISHTDHKERVSPLGSLALLIKGTESPDEYLLEGLKNCISTLCPYTASFYF
jgi:hypothetical protein